MSNETKYSHPLLLRVVLQNKSSLISKKLVPNKVMLLKIEMFSSKDQFWCSCFIIILTLFGPCDSFYFFFNFISFVFCLKQSHNLHFSAFLCRYIDRCSLKLKCVLPVWHTAIFFSLPTRMNTLGTRFTDALMAYLRQPVILWRCQPIAPICEYWT